MSNNHLPYNKKALVGTPNYAPHHASPTPNYGTTSYAQYTAGTPIYTPHELPRQQGELFYNEQGYQGGYSGLPTSYGHTQYIPQNQNIENQTFYPQQQAQFTQQQCGQPQPEPEDILKAWDLETETSMSIPVLQPEDRMGDLHEQLTSAAHTATTRHLPIPVKGVGVVKPIQDSEVDSDEEVDSPGRARSSSPSSDTSVASSLASSASRAKKSHKKKSRKNRSRSKDRSKRRHSKSRSRSRSTLKQKKNATDSMPPPQTVPTKQTPPKLPTDSYVNGLFNKISAEKSLITEAADPDTMSRCTSVSKRSRSAHYDVTKLLHETLRENELAKATLHMIMKMYSRSASGVRKNVIGESARCMRFVPLEASPDLASQYPDTAGYLFSAMKIEYGYDYKSIMTTKHYKGASLFNAFSPNCDLTTDSLDMVFRQALKELAMETMLAPIDDNKVMCMENPVYICARYLELTLIKKIRTHYLDTLNEDVLVYFTKKPTPIDMKVHALVEKCACPHYLERLISLYRLSPQTFEETLAEPFDSLKMRLWTDRKNQFDTNFKVINLITPVFSKKSAADAKSPTTSGDLRVLAKSYYDTVEQFIGSQFMSECMKTSELTAWLCFGFSSDFIDGIYHMLSSYRTIQGVQLESIQPHVLWNFPLATPYHKQPVIESTNERSRSIVSDDFFDNMSRLEQRLALGAQ